VIADRTSRRRRPQCRGLVTGTAEHVVVADFQRRVGGSPAYLRSEAAGRRSTARGERARSRFGVAIESSHRPRRMRRTCQRAQTREVSPISPATDGDSAVEDDGVGGERGWSNARSGASRRAAKRLETITISHRQRPCPHHEGPPLARPRRAATRAEMTSSASCSPGTIACEISVLSTPP